MSLGQHRARVLASLVAVAAAGALAACGSASGGAQSPTGSGTSTRTDGACTSPTHLTLMLRWIFNAQFAGSLIAQHDGLYKAQCLDITLKPGGPAVSSVPLLTQGKVDIGITGASNVANADDHGANLKIVAAGYQHSPIEIVSLPDNPIRNLSDLRGKKLGVSPVYLAAMQTFLEAHDLPQGSVKLVTTQGDVGPLLSKQIDALETQVGTDDVVLQERGIKPVTIKLADNGFDVLDLTYAVDQTSLDDPAKRSAITRFLRAESEGWKKALADPEAAAKLVVDEYGTANGLDLKNQLDEIKALAPLFVTPATKPYGPLWMTPDSITTTVSTLQKLGFKAQQSIFDDSLIKQALTPSK